MCTNTLFLSYSKVLYTSTKDPHGHSPVVNKNYSTFLLQKIEFWNSEVIKDKDTFGFEFSIILFLIGLILLEKLIHKTHIPFLLDNHVFK